MSKLMRRRSVYNTTTCTARAPVPSRFDLLNTYLRNESQAKRSVYIQSVSENVFLGHSMIHATRRRKFGLVVEQLIVLRLLDDRDHAGIVEVRLNPA